MDLHGRFRSAAIEQGFPEDEVRRFAQFLRFAIWTGEHPGGAPVGQRGGLPAEAERLAAGSPELPFVASFDCAALPKVDDLPLPAEGSLLVFLDHEEAVEADSLEEAQSYARVVHVPAGTEPSADRGDDLFATVQADLPGWLAKDERDLSDYQRQQARDLPHRKELRALVGTLWTMAESGGVYLGGYSRHTGGVYGRNVYATPETEMALRNLKDRRPGLTGDEMSFGLEEELHQVLSEWMPLVQFKPDDFHVARFLIRREDFAAGLLDKAVCYTEFTE